MSSPIAYTYEADTHCPACAEARFGRCTFPRAWGASDVACVNPDHALPEAPDAFRHGVAIDAEGNPIGAVFPWDDWCPGSELRGNEHLVCGTCNVVIATCEHEPDLASEPECSCDACSAAAEYLAALPEPPAGDLSDPAVLARERVAPACPTDCAPPTPVQVDVDARNAGQEGSVTTCA